jgi:Holliday junction resolvasome RuvABC endonuclease subunit
MNELVWPAGHEAFYKQVKDSADQILSGVVLAIDPSSGGSSKPGFALAREGQLKHSGVINILQMLPIERRLQQLYLRIKALTNDVPNVFAIERIRGRTAHAHLQWAVGTSIAASQAPIFIEIPTDIWKAVAKTDPKYKKGDEADAIKMLEALLLLAGNEHS